MTAVLGFFLGQIFAILVRMGFWVNDTRTWGDYVRSRKFQAQHLIDLILGIMLFIAWGTGLIYDFALTLPESWGKWLQNLPRTPTGPLALIFVGFLLTCFLTPFLREKWLKRLNGEVEPPEPPEVP